MVFVAGMVLAGCGSDDGGSVLLRHSRNGAITIGITFDQPGIGYRRADGSLRGFDVDVATHVAEELGVSADRITWRQVLLFDRERVIESGEADMVVAAYSITGQRERRVSFAGPYFQAGQDILVRMNDTAVSGPESLDDRALCSVRGTTSAAEIKASYAWRVRLVEYDRFSDCVTALLTGDVDAVSTDDLILAGYAAQHPELLRVVGKTFSVERYGIGLRKDDSRGRAAINTALRSMVDRGAWAAALRRNFGTSGYERSTPPAIPEE